MQNLPLNLHWPPLNPAKIIIKKIFLSKPRILLWEVTAQNILFCLQQGRWLNKHQQLSETVQNTLYPFLEYHG